MADFTFKIKVTAQLRSEDIYRFASFDIEAKNNESFTPEKLFAEAEKQAKLKWADFLKITSLKILKEEQVIPDARIGKIKIEESSLEKK